MSGRMAFGRLLQDSPTYALTPWQQQSKIPQLYLNSAITPSIKQERTTNTFAPNLTYLRDFKPRKTQKRPFTFKSHPALKGDKNIAYLQCIQYSWTDPKAPLNPEKPKEQKVIIAQKRTRKGLQIKSIKKKIVDSSMIAGKHFPFFQDAASLKNRLLITQSKLNTTQLIKPATVDGSFFQRSKKRLSRKGLTVSHLSREFLTEISTIATISNRKRITQKCKTQQVPTKKDWLLQRGTFLEKNLKFKDWQRFTHKTLPSAIALPGGVG